MSSPLAPAAEATLVVGDAAALMVPGRAYRSPAEALLALEREPFAHLVVDAGLEVELFRVVQERRPQTTRVLVGTPTLSSRAHTVLPSNTPKAVALTRMRETQAVLADLRSSVVGDIVGQIENLPAMPRSYHQLVQVAEHRNTSIADVAEIVARDPPLAAKLLQIVNSALFGATRPVSSVAQAVHLLGLDALLGLTLSAQLFRTMEVSKHPSFSLEQFQQYSVRVARLARQVVHGHSSPAESFTAGLVHDVGRLVIALRFPERCDAIERAAGRGEAPAHVLERHAFGTTHAEVGARLLLDWGIPFSIVQAIALHHRPTADSGSAPVLLSVHVAQALLAPDPDSALDMAYVQQSGAVPRLEQWRTLAAAHAQLARSRG